MESAPFTVEITVRSYELDVLGHVNQAVYHQYTEIGRMEMLDAAGYDWHALDGRNVGPVLLESTMKYRRELRSADRVTIVTRAEVGEGKVFTMSSEVLKADGTLSAEMTGVFGFMDLDARKLEPSAREVVERACGKPEVLLG